MTNELQRHTSPQASSVINPEREISTYHVDIEVISSGERISNLITHHFSIEQCALDVIENLSDAYKLVQVYQPDSRLTLNKKQIEELYNEKS